MTIDIDNIFKNHKPFGDQERRYELLKAYARSLADALINQNEEDWLSELSGYRGVVKTLTPESPEQQKSLETLDIIESNLNKPNDPRQLVLAVQCANMFATAAIAINEKDDSTTT